MSLPLGCAVVAQESIHPAIVDRGRRPGRHAIFTLEAAALLAVVAVATALRAWHLGSLPDAIHYDEADSALTAERLLGLPFQPIAPTWGHNPSLYFYVMAALFRVAGDGIAVARLTSAIFGVLGVVAVYLVGRKIGGGAWGLCAAAVLAISRWSIHFSRFAESNIAAPLVITLCVAALAMAFARPGPFWFALYGVGLGLSALAYEGALLPAGATLCALGLHALTDARFRRAAWPAMLALPIGLVAGTLPFVTALAMDPGYVLWREHSMSLFTLAPDWPHRLSALRYTLRAHLLMFTVAGDAKGSDNVPWQPMLDAVTGACFLLGVGICLRRIRHWFYALLLLWLAASLLSGILSNPGDAPSAPRTVTAVAPLALIAALPLAALATLVANLLVGLRAPHGQAKGDAAPGRAATARTVRANLVAALVVAVPLGAALAQNVQEYFEVYPDSLIAWQEMDGPLTLLGRAIPLLVRQGYTISVDPLATWRGQVIAYTAGFLPAAYDPDRPIAPPPRGRGLALAIPASYSDVPPDFFADMHAIYPTARVITLAPAFDPAVVQYRIMLIPAAEVGHHAGVAVGPGRRPRANAQRRGAMRRTTGSGHGRS